MNRSSEIRKLLATHSNKEIADILCVSSCYVGQIRYQSKTKEPRKSWSDYESLLGVVPDEEIAKMKGVKKGSVTTQRHRLGIGGARQSKEEILQNKFFLQPKENSTMYVSCFAGIIDILSDSAIYEVKVDVDSNSLKMAVGQLFVYGLAYPNKKKIIVTNHVKASNALVKSVRSLGIEVITFT